MTTPVLTPLHQRKRFLEPEVVIMSRTPGASNREGFRDLGTRALDLDSCQSFVLNWLDHRELEGGLFLFRNRS